MAKATLKEQNPIYLLEVNSRELNEIICLLRGEMNKGCYCGIVHDLYEEFINVRDQNR